MRYLLDTDHVTLLFYGTGTEYESISARMSLMASDDVGISIVSFHEQFVGCHAILNRERRQSRIVDGYERMRKLFALYAAAQLIPYDSAASDAFDQLARHNLRIGEMDLRIAFIAIARDLVLVTRNASDFSRVPDLEIDDWSV